MTQYTKYANISVKFKLLPPVCIISERFLINFVQNIEGTAKPFSKPEDAVILMQIIDAIYESAESGKPVEID